MKSREDFCFNQKRLKVRIEFRVDFEVSYLRGSIRDTIQLFQEPHSASQHQATIALNYIHEHLCFILSCASIIKMCPEVIASLLYSQFSLGELHSTFK